MSYQPENPTSDIGTDAQAWLARELDQIALQFAPLIYSVSELPTVGERTIGTRAYATDGRKGGETAGNGTGIPVWWDGSGWRTYYDNTLAQA